MKKGKQGEGGGQPLKWKSPEELKNKIDEYFEWADKAGLHYMVSGLAYYLKCDLQTLLNYEHAEVNGWLKRVSDVDRRKYVESIKDAKRKILMYYEEALFNRSKATGAIFTLKNNYGWKDRQEIVNVNKDIVVDIIDDDESDESDESSD